MLFVHWNRRTDFNNFLSYRTKVSVKIPFKICIILASNDIKTIHLLFRRHSIATNNNNAHPLRNQLDGLIPRSYFFYFNRSQRSSTCVEILVLYIPPAQQYLVKEHFVKSCMPRDVDRLWPRVFPRAKTALSLATLKNNAAVKKFFLRATATQFMEKWRRFRLRAFWYGIKKKRRRRKRIERYR